MTEERKIQLTTSVDASGAQQGFDQVKQGARDMAQSITQAGETAGKGMDKIGDGAKRAADGTSRALSSLKSSMQRAAIDLQAAGKSISEKFEIKADFKGIDRADIQDQLAVLKQLEQAQRSAAQSQAAAAPGNALISGLQSQLASLREQMVAIQGGEAALLQYRAAEAGVSAQAAPLITQFVALRDAMNEKAAADAAATASAKEQAASLKQQAAAQESFLASLRDRAATTGLDPNDQLRARASQLGVAAQAEPLIAQTVSAQAEQDQARFLASLQGQADAIGKTRAQLLALQAAKLGVTDKAAPLIAALEAEEKGAKGFGEGAAFSTVQVQGLVHAVKSFADQVIAGGSPLRAAALETGRLSGTFGGLGNAVSAITSLITPMRVVMLGAAAGVGVLGLAMADAESKARSLATVQAQLAGTGRSDLFSTKDLKSFLNELSLAPGVSRDTATAMVSELSKVHDIGGGIFKDLAKTVVDYAKATGQDIPSATKQIALAFAEPSKGVQQLEDALGKLSSKQMQTVQDLAKGGDLIGAQRALYDALQSSVKGLADNAMTPLQDSVNKLGNAWGNTMQALDKSDGLRNLNALLGETIKGVAWLLERGPSLGTALANTFPAAGLVIDTANLAGAALGGNKPKNPTASGKVTDLSGAVGANAASQAISNKVLDEGIKATIKATAGYRSQAQEIADVIVARKRLTEEVKNSITVNGKDSPVTKELQGRVVGANERIAAAQKKAGSHEPQQVALAQAQADEKQIEDLLQRRKDAFGYAEQFLQGAYEAGAISLKDFFDQQRETTAAAVDAQISTLETRKARYEQLLKNAAFKDPSQRVTVRGKIDDITEQETQARQQASEAAVLSIQKQTASQKQLNDELQNYRANLLQLAGDETGAARLRSQIADRQDAELKTKSAGQPGALKDAELAAAKKERDDQVALTDAKTQTSRINQQLQIQEDRIALAQSIGAIGEIDALKQEGTAREQAVAKMQEQLAVMEKLSNERPKDLQLKVDVEGFRLQIDKLKATLDPLKDKFDGIFKDAGSNLFSDLMNGTKAKDALKNLAGNITKPINDFVAKELSQSLFGSGKSLGGVGGFFADIFGGKDRTRQSEILAQNASITATSAAQTEASAAISTASASSSAALTSLAASAEAAATALSTIAASGGGGGGGLLGGLGGGPSAIQAAFSQTPLGSSGFGTGLAYGNQDIGLFIGDNGGYTGHADPRKVAGIVHGQEYVFSAPAVRAIGLERLERLHQRAKYGRMEDAGVPGYSDGGYVSSREWPVMTRSTQYMVPPQETATTGDTHVHHSYSFDVHVPQGTARATAQQIGAQVMTGAMVAFRRSGKRI